MGRDLSKAQMIVLVIACFGIFLSGFMLFKTAREYKLAEDEYAALDKFTTKVDSTALAPMSLGPVAIEEEVTEELARNYNRADFPDIDVDFDGLAEINDQVVAWLVMESVDISYPVVQNPEEGENEYYLHHTFENESNSSGCVFMDWESKPDLSGWNTLSIRAPLSSLSSSSVKSAVVIPSRAIILLPEPGNCRCSARGR